MHAKRALAVSILVIALAAIALASTSIKWKPAVNSTYRFKWVASSDDYPGPSGATSIRQEETDNDTIKEIGATGSIVTQIAISGVTASIGGKALNPSTSGKTIMELVVQRKDGLVISKQTDTASDVSDPRIESMERVIYPDHPVNVGDVWTYSEVADPSKGTHDNQSTFTYSGRETLLDTLCYKVAVHYQEKGILLPIRADGFIWLSCADGELVKKDIAGENVTIANSAKPFKLRLTTERIGTNN